jgi:hypothetical protein
MAVEPHHAEHAAPTRMLTKEDVADLIDLPQAMACIEEAFLQQARGTVTPWPPAMMRTGTSHLIMRSGGLAEMERHGLRVSVGPRGRDFALLFDTVRKELLSLMAYPFTELRLAAATGVGVRALARADARRVAVLGSGRNAPGILQAITLVRPIEAARVYSPTRSTVMALRPGRALRLASLSWRPRPPRKRSKARTSYWSAPAPRRQRCGASGSPRTPTWQPWGIAPSSTTPSSAARR